MGFFDKIKSGFDAVLHPATCAICNEYHEYSMYWVCRKCWKNIGEETVPASQNIETDKIGVISAYFGWHHQDGIRQLIHSLKYQKHHSIGWKIGLAVRERLAGSIDFSQIDYLIPVPLHKKRAKERGFNQSFLLACGMASGHKNLHVVNALHRAKFTDSQVMLSGEARRNNVKNAFALNQRIAKKMHGSSVAIIDDVLTTGATSLACCSALETAQVAHIKIITVALAGFLADMPDNVYPAKAAIGSIKKDGIWG
ncbi:MAG: ComF family protein [Calditrichaeota bacterium]|nr:MAG: ComF family protein [Calditrichota bacterium]